jgi:hypothetical protein
MNFNFANDQVKNINFAKNKKMQIAGVVILCITTILFVMHRRSEYKGKYDKTFSYKTISPLKHDILKTIWTATVTMLILGLGSDETFFDYNNILGSFVGQTMASSVALFTYYELFEPYVGTRLLKW